MVLYSSAYLRMELQSHSHFHFRTPALLRQTSHVQGPIGKDRSQHDRPQGHGSKPGQNQSKGTQCNYSMSITEPPPPKDITIMEVAKLCKEGFTVIFKDEEVIKWIHNKEVEYIFAAEISPGSSITRHVFPILVPCIPLTLNPSHKEAPQGNKRMQ